MYAVLVTGGKQHRVMQGETLRVEKLEGDVGSELKFDNVLMLGDAGDLDFGVVLPVAHLLAMVLAAAELDDADLVGAAVADDLGGDG
jgi:large subunit ribosomal protein L21